jgi:hypothetical protein
MAQNKIGNEDNNNKSKIIAALISGGVSCLGTAYAFRKSAIKEILVFAGVMFFVAALFVTFK